jgi:hypothetical protein
MPAEIPAEISRLIDGWCERRALRPLRIILPHWPPMNGFTDELQRIWAAMRHLRAMCCDDLANHDEIEAVSRVIAGLTQKLFPRDDPHEIEDTAEKLIAVIFGDQRE